LTTTPRWLGARDQRGRPSCAAPPEPPPALVSGGQPRQRRRAGGWRKLSANSRRCAGGCVWGELNFAGARATVCWHACRIAGSAKGPHKAAWHTTCHTAPHRTALHAMLHAQWALGAEEGGGGPYTEGAEGGSAEGDGGSQSWWARHRTLAVPSCLPACSLDPAPAAVLCAACIQQAHALTRQAPLSWLPPMARQCAQGTTP
jgi:hypothetical protein